MFEKYKAAFDEYSDFYCAGLPDEVALSEISFSERFQKRMDRLLRRQKRFYYPLINTAAKRVASILIACLLLMAATTASVKGLREMFIQFVTETFENFSSVLFIEESQSMEKIQHVAPNYPQYIPEGFSLVYELEDTMGAQRIYERDECSVTFEQHLINGELDIGINTEGSEYKKVIINEKYEAMLVENMGLRMITFRIKNHAYVISINDSFSESELIKIAESIKF